MTLQTGRTGDAGTQHPSPVLPSTSCIYVASDAFSFSTTVRGQSVMTTDDYDLLNILGHIADTLAPFSFGILTNTLSVTDQLDFGYKLIAAAGRIRTRVEKTSADHRLRPTDGDAP